MVYACYFVNRPKTVSWCMHESPKAVRKRAALLRGNGGLRGLLRLVAYASQNAPRISARGMIGVAEEYAR